MIGNFFYSSTGAAAYEIEQSLRFDGSAYLNRTPASAGNRRTFTFSAWVKRANLAATCFLITQGPNPGSWDAIRFDSNDRLAVRINNDANVVDTVALFRDPSAWYHIVIAVDTTQATAANRVKIYINNQQDSINNTGYPSQNQDLAFNNNVAARVGIPTWNTSESLRGYLAEVNFIDGSALSPTDFGEEDDNGVWRPIKYAGSYTGNSFYLKFDAADVDGDSSGLGNDWTASAGISTSGTGTDVMSDTPTTNWCTLNPLTTGSYVTLSNGNLDAVGNTSSDAGNTRTTFVVTGGKFYFEMTLTANIASNYPNIGIMRAVDGNRPNNGYPMVGQSTSMIYGSQSVSYLADGSKLINSTAFPYGNSYGNGDVIGVAYDGDNGAIYFSKNGTWQNSGDPTSGASKTGAALTWTDERDYVFSSTHYNGSALSFNFGQRAFAYTPPTGFKELNTSNLPAPDIADGSDYFQTVLYQGNDPTGQDITVADNSGNAWQPDFVWIKARGAAYWHRLYDAVRGATKEFYSNATDPENTDTNALTSFNSDGFTLGSDQGVNQNTYNFVSWNWKAANGTSTPSGGSIASTVSANPTAGFSIVSYTGTGSNGTVAHGLGVAPSFMIVRNRDEYTSWAVYHKSLGGTKYLNLDQLTAATANIAWWNNTDPTDTVFSVGTRDETNSLSKKIIAYCFAEVEGYSKIGKYHGNSSNDGVFVYTGFKPAFIMVKGDLGQDWFIADSVRDPYNVSTRWLRPNLSNVEINDPSTGGSSYDILSNGFKWYTNTFGVNRDYDYYYIAFAQHPFGGDGVSPATAR